MQTTLEKQHVQEVYEAIAIHFSETRYKPWPLVEKHVQSFAPGSIVADVGCGNGKYLGCNPQAFALGSDQSTNLIKICKTRGFESLIADGLHLPFRDQSCDFAICIAVVHHFSTRENRIHALQELKRIVRVGGQVLVTVWAFEQERKKYTEQDVMVKWHLQKRFDPNVQQTGPTQKKRKKQRNAPTASSSTSSDSTLSDTATISSIKSSTVPDTQSDPATTAPVTEAPSVVLDRYYHLFKKGELDELAIAAGGYAIVQSVWDVDNWYLLLERTE